MSEHTEPGEGLGPTAAIITIGDEIVEGRVLNENATWLSDELMTRGVWPRLVIAVPDVPYYVAKLRELLPRAVIRVQGEAIAPLFNDDLAIDEIAGP